MHPETTHAAVQMLLLPAFAIMGLSHIIRPAMWVKFFGDLHDQGTSGVVLRTFALELWPALVIVTLHPVWSGPGLVLTLYGWALALKCTVSLLAPQIGLRSLAMASRGPRVFVIGGGLLLAMSGVCFWALIAGS
jgi:hypothetical protein